MEAEANSSDGGFDDLEMPDPQELSNTGGNSNDEDRQVRSGFGWTGNVKNFGTALMHLLFARSEFIFYMRVQCGKLSKNAAFTCINFM